jgi:type IV pilus assembly protein PilV
MRTMLQPNPRGQYGFSLIEILVSLVLVTLSLLGMAALLATTHKNTASSQQRTQASILGANITERMRANREYVLAHPDAYSDLRSDECKALPAASATVELDRQQIVCLVRAALPGAKPPTITVDDNLVTVRLEWDDSRGTGQTGTEGVERAEEGDATALFQFEYQTQL